MLLVALTSGQPTGVGQGDRWRPRRPGVVGCDDAAEGLAHGAGADAGGPVMRRSALSMRLVTVVLVVAGVGSGVVLVSAAALR